MQHTIRVRWTDTRTGRTCNNGITVQTDTGYTADIPKILATRYGVPAEFINLVQVSPIPKPRAAQYRFVVDGNVHSYSMLEAARIQRMTWVGLGHNVSPVYKVVL